MYWIDRFSNWEQQLLYEQTQTWAENLRQSTIDSSLSYAWTKSDLMIQQRWLEYERDLHSLVWFLSALDKLLEEIEDTKKWISKRWLSKAWKKVMEESKNKLKQYEKQLKGKKKALLKQNKSGRVEIYENDIAHLRGLRQQLNLTRKEIWMWQRWEYASISSYLYNSPEIARKSNEYQADNLEFNQKLQKELKKWAVLRIFNWNVEEANNFYRRIAQWEYNEVDYQLYVTNSSVLAPSFQRCGIIIPKGPRWVVWYRTVQWNERIPTTVRRSVDYGNMDWGDTFKQWWVSWVFDKLLSNCNNLTPWQRETWKSLWVLACVAWSIYWLYKFYTNKKMWFWAKAWITAWTIFGTEFLLWETPLSLFNKVMSGWLSWDEIKNRFGNAVSGIGLSSSESSESTWWIMWAPWESVSETVVPAMYSMMIFNASTKKSDIDKMTQTFKDNNENRKTFYEKSCTKLEKEYGTQAMECFRATFSDQFDEEKWNNRLASFGVTNATSQNESIYWLANNATMNKTILEKFKADNWLKENDSDELEAYIQNKKSNNQAIDIDDLNAHKNDWFSVNEKATHTERPEDIQNKENLVNKVGLLSIDSTQKQELKQAIQDFYDERSIESKPNLNDFHLKIENGLLIIKSHNWQETQIDISSRTLKSKNNIDISFPTLSEAINSADLTNDILQITNKQSPANLPPFQYQRWQKAICFNDAKLRSFDLDTRIKSISRFFDRSTIDKNADIYTNYLSQRRKEANKLNLTNYPIVNQLWMDFYSNENEVKKLENYLKWVKEKLKVFKCHPDWNPFSIEVWTNKLRFRAINWDVEYFQESISDEFPTLTRSWNEEKFLKFLNNPSNKMRWTTFN